MADHLLQQNFLVSDVKTSLSSSAIEETINIQALALQSTLSGGKLTEHQQRFLN